MKLNPLILIWILFFSCSSDRHMTRDPLSVKPFHFSMSEIGPLGEGTFEVDNNFVPGVGNKLNLSFWMRIRNIRGSMKILRVNSDPEINLYSDNGFLYLQIEEKKEIHLRKFISLPNQKWHHFNLVVSHKEKIFKAFLNGKEMAHHKFYTKMIFPLDLKVPLHLGPKLGKIGDLFIHDFKLLHSIRPQLMRPYTRSHRPPNSYFTSSEPIVGKPPLMVHFISNLSRDTDGKILAKIWDFGDGDIAVGDNPKHRYHFPGEYFVSLTVVDDGLYEHKKTLRFRIREH